MYLIFSKFITLIVEIKGATKRFLSPLILKQTANDYRYRIIKEFSF